MFKVKVENNLNAVLNKIDMLKINIESAAADAVMSADSEIKDVFNNEYFENTEIEMTPSVDGLEINIKNLDEDYYYYQNTTGNSYYDLGNKVKEVISNKLKSKFGGLV
jgi:hypothetical protein